MLTDELIEQNKSRFLELVNKINRPGVRMDMLLKQLEHSDFFVSPASSVYHCAFKGGLVHHCLHVYDTLCQLVAMSYPDAVNEDGTTTPSCPYSEESLIIVALFHDFSKMNFYEPEFKNKKVYSPLGKKKDEMGNFDWISVPGYKIKDANDRLCYGSHEMNAVYMTESFIPLSIEESVAILHHMGGMSKDSSDDEIPSKYSKYPLALLLHLADMYSTYQIESHE